MRATAGSKGFPCAGVNKQDSHAFQRLGPGRAGTNRAGHKHEPHHKAKLDVARTLCSAHLGNKYTALPTRCAGYDHSSHSPLSQGTCSLCHFFEAVGVNLCHHMPIGAKNILLLILKHLSVCVFLK